MDIYLKNFIECDAETLYEVFLWRNHTSVRLTSINQNEFNIEEHLKFIDILSKDKTKLYFVVTNNNINIGVINFVNITKVNAYVGYYKNPYIKMHGVGKVLIRTAIDYAYNHLKLEEVYMEVLYNNRISIYCIMQQGFQEIERNNNIVKYKLRLI